MNRSYPTSSEPLRAELTIVDHLCYLGAALRRMVVEISTHTPMVQATYSGLKHLWCLHDIKGFENLSVVVPVVGLHGLIFL